MDSPLVPDLPYEFREVLIVTACYRTDPEAIRRLVPEPLAVTSDRVLIHIYRMTDTDWFGSYNESAVHVGVELSSANEKGAYSPYLFLDHDGAIAFGREVYGQPKKFGSPSIEVRQDLVVARVERNGIDIITITMPYKVERATISDIRSHLEFVTNINLKVIPSADGTSAIRQLTARELLDTRVHECWRSPVTVELRPNANAPVFRLPCLEPLEGFLWRCDFKLGPGRIIHNYLAAGEGA
jgi:acetoacetate decarboxylase